MSTTTIKTAWHAGHLYVLSGMRGKLHKLDLETGKIISEVQLAGTWLSGLDVRNGHVNRSTWSGKIDSLVEGTYVHEMVVALCGENMACHFPEITDVDDAVAMWRPVVSVD